MAIRFRPPSSISSIAEALRGGVIDFIQSMFGNWMLTPSMALDVVYGAFPLLASDDVQQLVEMAQEQRQAGRAFGTQAAFTTPRLSEIPTCPGCPPNKVETTVRVTVVDVFTGRQVTHGIVHCVDQGIPDEQSISDCADAWGDDMVETHYRDTRGYQILWEVVSAQRGLFFGR